MKRQRRISCGVLRGLDADAGTAFRRQEAQHAVHGGEIDPVEHLAPLLVLHNKARVDQRRQVMGQGGRGKPKVGADVAHPQPIFARLHQNAEDRQAGIVAKGGKRAGMLAGHRHATQHNYNSGFVKAFVGANCLAAVGRIFWGIAVFRWDITIRESTILGLVGAGGLGLKLESSLNSLAWSQVTVILLLILATVVLSEWVSARVRHAII